MSMSPIRGTVVRFWILSLVSSLTLATLDRAAFSADVVTFPEPPGPASFVDDRSGGLSETAKGAFEEHAQRWFDSSSAPAALLVVESLSEFGVPGADAGPFARSLLLHWGRQRGGARSSSATDGSSPPDAISTEGDGPADGGGVAVDGDEIAAPSSDAADVPSGNAPPASDPSAADWAQRGIAVVVARSDRRVAVATGRDWLASDEQRRRVERVFGAYFDDGDPEGAYASGFAAIDQFLLGKRVSMPGDSTAAMLFGILFVVIFVTVIAYSRSGTESFAWKLWVSVFSGLGVALTFLLRRGVNLTSRLAAVAASDSDKGRIVVGGW